MCTVMKCDVVKVMLALGFEVVDSYNLAEGYNCGVRYYNGQLNAAMQELGL